MQGGEDPRYCKAVANCKHFAAYDLEQWEGYSPLSFNAVVSDQELVEYFLVLFERCVRDARAGSIMCSSNAVNGVPACADGFLLQTVARELWASVRWRTAGWCPTATASAPSWARSTSSTRRRRRRWSASRRAPTSAAAPYRDFLPQAVREGQVTEEELDRFFHRLTASLLRTDYWDDGGAQPYRRYNASHVNSADHLDTSYRAALQSVTLLKNAARLLQLDTRSKPLAIALVGSLAVDTFYVQGNYRGTPPYVITLRDALEAESNVKVVYTHGADEDSRNTSDFDAALAAAKPADYSLYPGGLTENQEREGGDRETLVWPGVQQALIQQLAAASAKPIVVLVMGGGQIDLSAEVASERVGAIAWIGTPACSWGERWPMYSSAASRPPGGCR